MKRNLFETILGAVVLIVAAIFMFFAYSATNIGTGGGYTVTAKFNKIGSLATGNEVRISGVKVGNVSKIELDANTFQAKTTFDITKDVRLPVDSMAQVVTEGLMGGYYVQLTPGIEEDMIADGGEIALTQAPVDLLDLLGRFIFSTTENDKKS